MDFNHRTANFRRLVYWRNQHYTREEVRKKVNLRHIHFIIKGNQLEEKSVEAKS